MEQHHEIQRREKEIETDVQQKYADSNYIHLYQIKLLAGRNISTSDTVTSFMINETYAHILGFQQPEQAIGKYLEWSDKLYAITGVVADFNQHSLHEPVKPMALGSWQSTERTINIALQPQNDAWHHLEERYCQNGAGMETGLSQRRF